MRKLLGISLVAVMVAVPFVANADPTPIANTPATTFTNSTAGLASNGTNVVRVEQGGYFAGKVINVEDQRAAASAAYVKGAYNDAIAAVNAVHEEVGSAITGGGAGIAASGNKVSIDVTKTTNNGVSTNVSGLDFDNNGTPSDSTDDTIKVKSGNGIKVDSGGVQVNYTNKGGLQLDGSTDGSKTLSVKTDGSTILKRDSDGALKVGTISKSNISSDDIKVSTGTHAADTDLATEGYVVDYTASITNGMVTTTGTQTLTNKTIDADENTIKDLTTTNLKAGTLVKSQTGGGDGLAASVATASDTKVASEKAIVEAIADHATKTGVAATVNAATGSVNNVSLSVSGNSPMFVNWGDSSATGNLALANGATATGNISGIDISVDAYHAN